jgi:hypothetical protein
VKDVFNLAKLIFFIALLLWAGKTFVVARDNCPVDIFWQSSISLEKEFCKLAYGYKYGN